MERRLNNLKWAMIAKKAQAGERDLYCPNDPDVKLLIEIETFADHKKQDVILSCPICGKHTSVTFNLT